jgi:hypothetical protein
VADAPISTFLQNTTTLERHGTHAVRMSYEVIFLSELNETHLKVGKRIRTIGVLDMETISSSPMKRLKWKDSPSLRVDLEYVQSVRVMEGTFYQVLGEIQEDRVSDFLLLIPRNEPSFTFQENGFLFLKVKLLINSDGIDLRLFETVITERRKSFHE